MTYKEKSAGGILGTFFSLFLRRGQKKRRSCFSFGFFGPPWIWLLELLYHHAAISSEEDPAERHCREGELEGALVPKGNELALRVSLLYRIVALLSEELESGRPAPDEGLPHLFPNTLQGFSHLRVLVPLPGRVQHWSSLDSQLCAIIPLLERYAPPTISTGHTESLKESVQVTVCVPYTSTHPASEWVQSSPEVSIKLSPKPMGKWVPPGLTVL